MKSHVLLSMILVLSLATNLHAQTSFPMITHAYPVALQRGATLKDLVAGLNALGVGPRDLITILQAIKAAGALQADIEVM